MGRGKGCLPASLFTYEEPRVVKVHSISLFVTYQLLILLVLGLILGYMMIYNRGWEKEDEVESAVTTKLHGLAYTDNRIWDNAEYMVPPKENGAFTVITSLLETHQHEGKCAEHPSVRAALCTTDSDCTTDRPVYLGNGVMTGSCVSSPHKADTRVCQIRAWCPVEIHDSERHVIANENFTVDIKNYVKFPSFHINRQNFRSSMTEEELSTCTYDENDPTNRYCPVFKVATIVEKAGYTFQDMVQAGGVIEMIIEWDCTFGWTNWHDEECFPSYRFLRLDETDTNHTQGFHMRYAEHYQGTDGTMRRTLYRAYGIRVIVTVHGQGWKFDWGNFVKTFGSGVGYFAVAAFIVSKVILKYFHRKLHCCHNDCFSTPRDHNRHQKMDDAIAANYVCGDTPKVCEWLASHCSCCQRAEEDAAPVFSTIPLQDQHRPRQIEADREAAEDVV